MQTDVLIIGAGAAGLMCAIEAGKRGRSVVVVDHAPKIAEKIRISGGGRCNFTNINVAPDKYISRNPHFCKSALKRYTPHDFIALVEKHGIAYHEKTLGQLFCDRSAKEIIQMLLDECAAVNVSIRSGISVQSIKHTHDDVPFRVTISQEGAQSDISAESLVVATGGPAIPKMGATGFGYAIARQFGLNVISDRAGLVPLVFDEALLAQTKELSGLSVDPARATSVSGMSFDEALLFTHRGISGPVILQISSYWQQGEDIVLDLAPHMDVFAWLRDARRTHAKQALHTVLSDILPKRLAMFIAQSVMSDDTVRMADVSDAVLQKVAARIQKWHVTPIGSEGYRTAEVALGGVDTDDISSKTFEAKTVPGLYFIGEVLDVTGHLGGYNFQWAWASGWCAGQVA